MEDIYNSGKYRGWHKEVELTWSKDLHFPQSREVHFYESDVWQAIRDATHGSPLAVWLLGDTVDKFVLKDGRNYRTQECNERLLAICAKLGSPELANIAFGENHAASIMAKERNDWKPTQPASSQTSRRLVWSTDTAGYGTRWAMTRGKSLLSTNGPAIRHPSTAWVRRNPISSVSGTQHTA